MNVFGVAGNPILHSMSPLIYRALFKNADMDAVYTRIHSPNAERAIQVAREIRMEGLNVTSPFKEHMIPLMDETDDDVRLVDALNTVTFTSEGTRGANTDIVGVINMFKGHRVELGGQRVIALGTGGAARASARAALLMGASVIVVGRSVDKAEHIAQRLGCHAGSMTQLPMMLRSANVLISCLPRFVNPIARSWLHPRHVVVDANYGETDLLRTARSVGCTMIDSRSWLLHQAFASYRIFTGRDPAMAISLEILSSGEFSSDASRSIALIGMMGAGKTTVGRLLARLLGWTFVDTDEIIETQTGMSIPEIFRERGESSFRLLERTVIEEISKRSRTVIALGGGAVLDERNRSVLSKCLRSICLWADAETLQGRLTDSPRPLLEVDGVNSGLRELLSQRRLAYVQTADLILDATSRVSSMVRSLLRRRKAMRRGQSQPPHFATGQAYWMLLLRAMTRRLHWTLPDPVAPLSLSTDARFPLLEILSSCARLSTVENRDSPCAFLPRLRVCSPNPRPSTG